MFILRTLVSVMGGFNLGDFETDSISGVERYRSTPLKISFILPIFSLAGLFSPRKGSSAITSSSFTS